MVEDEGVTTSSGGSEDSSPQLSFYDRVGGHATFDHLMRAFFDAVRDDEALAPMYAHDFDGSRERLQMFFEQYWGGPPAFSRERGAPMLRMRHMPYKITPAAMRRWLRHMHGAISLLTLGPEDEFLMRDYVERAAKYLVNADD